MYHTKYFRTVDEVEHALSYTFTPGQYEMVFTYIVMGVRPEAGNCYGCSPAFIRRVTGEIDQYERDVTAGRREWPWNGDEAVLDAT